MDEGSQGKKKGREKIKTYEVDLSKGWDTVSHKEIFLEYVRNLPFYKPGLLYSGFHAEDIGKSSSEIEGVVFCASEEDILNPNPLGEDPFKYAIKYDEPAIAIYDPSKMKEEPYENYRNIPMQYAYRPKDPSALLAVIRLKFEMK